MSITRTEFLLEQTTSSIDEKKNSHEDKIARATDDGKKNNEWQKKNERKKRTHNIALEQVDVEVIENNSNCTLSHTNAW